MIKTTITGLLNFLKKPDDRQISLSLANKIYFTLILFAFEIVISFAFIFPVLDYIDEMVKIKEVGTEPSTLLEYALMGAVIIPIAEEFIFRYFLRYKGLKAKIISRERWNKVFPYLVYIFGIAFGFMHVYNYTNSGYIFLALSPLIILSQLTGGLVLTFIRVRLSFIWGVLYHGLWNFLFMIAIPIIDNAVAEPYTESTINYTISVDEELFLDKEKPQVIQIDSAASKIQSMHLEQYFIQQLLDTLYRKNRYYTDDVLINLDLESSKGISKEEVIKILEKEYNIE